MTKAADRRRRARRVAVRFAQLHAYSLTCLLDLGVRTARYERFELLQLRNRPAVLSLVELLPAGPMADKDDNSPIDFDEAEGAEAAEGFSLPAAGDAPLSVGRTELDEESLGDDFAIPFAEGAEAAEGTTLPAAEDAPLGDDRGEGRSEGRVFDDVTADSESLRRMFSCVQDACLAAMPYEVVAANAGTEKSREHEASLKSEMCKAACMVPADFKGPFLEHVDVLVSGVMEAARKEKLQIGSLIQTKWRTMTPQEKRPWEHLYEQKSNVGPSPFYLWLQDAMREEWARRRGNVPQSTS